MPGARALTLAWAAWLLAGCGQPLPDSDAAFYLGDPGRRHYSPLTQIDRDNVASLQPAWVYDTDELADGVSTMYTSPLVVDGVLYGLTPRLNAFALDAATGAALWRFDTDAAGGLQRGLTWWESSAGARLFYSAGSSLVALDPATGRPVSGFGIGGRLDLRDLTGGIEVSAPSPGVTFGHLLVLGLEFRQAPGGASVVAVDARDGRVAIKGWTEGTSVSSLELAQQMAGLGVLRLLYTDIARDGTLTEPNVDANAALVQSTGLSVLASGGIASLEHIRRLTAIGVDGVVLGRALYTGDIKLEEAVAVAHDPGAGS